MSTLTATREGDQRYRADWHITDNAAALFTWSNGQTMRAATVMDADEGRAVPVGHEAGLRVRCIPRTKTGRDYRSHYGVWLPLDALPTEFAAALRAALEEEAR